MVEQLAPVLSAEDAREFRADLFARALVAPDSLVRRIGALAAGRIGDHRATPLVVHGPEAMAPSGKLVGLPRL